VFPVQRRALTSIAVEPTSQPLAYEYLQRYHVPVSSLLQPHQPQPSGGHGSPSFFGVSSLGSAG